MYKQRGVLRGIHIPNIVTVLPLCPQKVEVVKKDLSNIHPKSLLFMSKIKKLAVHELEHMDLNRTYTIFFYEKLTLELLTAMPMNPSFCICQQKKINFQRNNVVVTRGGSGFLWKTNVGLSRGKESKNGLLHQIF